jgi:SHS2 domain-containing protein
MGFGLLEHTADLGIEARGDDLSAALDQAVAALGTILAGPSEASADDQQPVELDATDPEALVVALLSECLYLLEVDGWLARGARLTLTGGSARGVLLGEPYDPDRHDGLAIKAITWHQLAVRQSAEGVTITVYVDC